jgi:ATP-dependent DNA helicase RecQ
MISAIRQNKTLGLMPTGAGKSLCFQVPTTIQHGCAIVVCPITALIRDHVAELNDFGFKRRAYAISTETPGDEREFILERLVRGHLKFLFLSPEQLQKLNVREKIAETNAAGYLAYIVIDEVHCVSEWGHDFRTSYLTLSKTLDKYATGVRVICLTATASVRVMNDIKAEFSIPDGSVFYFMQRSREELIFKVIKADDKKTALKECLTANLSFTPSNDNSFLVFSPTVNGPTGVAKLLPLIRSWLSNTNVFLFSGKTPKSPFSLEIENQLLAKFDNKAVKNFSDYKHLVQRLFKANKINGIIATKSFGMGINKPNIRATFHCGLPSSMEALYQEAGRAGRDGHPSTCITILKVDPDIPDEIFDPGTDATTLKLWCDKQNMDAGDFSSQMWLFTRELLSVSEEVIACKKVLKELRSKNIGSVLLLGHSQKILYRLYQLGFIKDWTVENFSKDQYRIEWVDQTPQQIASNIHSYISKYELTAEEQKVTKVRLFHKANSLEKEQAEEELTKELLQWMYDNFFYQRRQSLKNLFDACSDFDDQNPDRFRRRLEAYFQLNEDRYLIQDVVAASADQAPSLVKQLITEPNGRLKSPQKIEELFGSALRFLESYPTNVGLDLLSAVCRSLYNDFENADGRLRMERFLSILRVSKEFSVGWNNLLDLLNIVPQSIRETLIDCVVTSYPEPASSLELYELFKSDVAFESCARNMNHRVNRLIGV